MKIVILMSTFAFAACATTAAPTQPSTLPKATATDCPPRSDCRIGSNGTKLTGLTIALPDGVQAVAVPSGELVRLR